MYRLIRVLVAAGLVALPTSALADGLGLTLDELLSKVKASAAEQGAALELKKVGCAENPKPGDDTKKIISCSHSAGDGKIFITNADPAGPLLDVSTQMWPEAQAVSVIGWIAGAVNGTPPSDYEAAASKLVAEAKSNNTSLGSLGKGQFIVLALGGKFVVSVSTP